MNNTNSGVLLKIPFLTTIKNRDLLEVYLPIQLLVLFGTLNEIKY